MKGMSHQTLGHDGSSSATRRGNPLKRIYGNRMFYPNPLNRTARFFNYWGSAPIFPMSKSGFCPKDSSSATAGHCGCMEMDCSTQTHLTEPQGNTKL